MATKKATKFKYSIKSKVSLPDFTFAENEREYIFQPEAAIIRPDPTIDTDDTRRDGMGQPHKMRMVNLETGELVSALVPSLLAKQLIEAYPADRYVGRCFVVVMHAPKRPKRYRTCEVSEIDLETTGESEVVA